MNKNKIWFTFCMFYIFVNLSKYVFVSIVI